ncbi:Methyltransferase FkbM [Macleaya cordata]|uniref:Methyltransferase FkbM n=1 Tax=Macleaya cordata TaxID=56857 RepID=A0A200QQJ6_MACCD|nr:Methyltransferase FkbM [Macleaya cordata]
MEPSSGKSSPLRNILVRMLLFGVFILLLRFVYVVTVTGGSCTADDFCFFSGPENINFAGAGVRRGSSAVAVAGVGSSNSALRDLWTSKEWRKNVDFYSSVFQDLISEGFLSPNSKALCVETPTGQDEFALKEIGVSDAIGISKKASPPLVKFGKAFRQPFDDNTFDFVFSGGGEIDRSVQPAGFASEIGRTLKPEGFLVVHTSSAKDMYSFNSFLGLFNCCRLVRSRDIEGPDSTIREIVLKKDIEILGHGEENPDGFSVNNKCSVPGHKQELVRNAEPLIAEEPLKPWITLKRNIKNIKYLPSMADISFKKKYVYVDVGARSYGSSIGSWFRKQYPKQNKTFEIYAIEADKAFHDEYKLKKGINLLPYAAWVRNETLLFEINRDPGQKIEAKGRGMGRIQPVKSSTGLASDVNKIQGFDFANWLKNTVSEKDFVVMKMDVEGTEFDLIPRLFETGAICLIDEIFLECHYNRWQRCCPGERSSKYEKSYGQCLELFNSLRDSGVLVHQWW